MSTFRFPPDDPEPAGYTPLEKLAVQKYLQPGTHDLMLPDFRSADHAAEERARLESYACRVEEIGPEEARRLTEPTPETDDYEPPFWLAAATPAVIALLLVVVAASIAHWLAGVWPR